MGTPKSTFVWHDLMTTDLEGSRKFYGALMGWKEGEFDLGEMGKYTMLQVGDEPLGGYMALDPSLGIPSHWVGYVSVESVDACCARAAELGGKVRVPPTDIPSVGRFAVLEDPQGGIFCPFRGGAPCEDAAPCEGADPNGRFVWNELLTSDPVAAAAFYTELLGWGHRTEPMGEAGEYHLFLQGDEMAGGMMKEPMPLPRPFWLPYLGVPDVDAAFHKASSLGASEIVPPRDIPGIGRFSVLKDPAGAVFALARFTEKEG
jgi:uncharacterized protein